MVNFIPSGNSANFYAVLKNFYEDLKAEWILQGNLAEDFKDKGCKFVIDLLQKKYVLSLKTCSSLGQTLNY